MDKIKKKVKEFNERLRLLHEKGETHVFDVTVTERYEWVELTEQCIQTMKLSYPGEAKSDSFVQIEEAMNELSGVIHMEKDIYFLRAAKIVVSEIESLQNKMNGRGTLLLATGLSLLDTSLKTVIHHFHFSKMNVVFLEALEQELKEKQPSAVVISEALSYNGHEDKYEKIISLCEQYDATTFVLMGDDFQPYLKKRSLQNVSWTGSVLENAEETLACCLNRKY